MISALAPLSERNSTSVFSSLPDCSSWPTMRPISRSIRSTMAACTSILAAWKAFCSAERLSHASGRFNSFGPSASIALGNG